MSIPLARDEIFDKVKGQVVEVLRIPPENITLETNYIDLGVDSLDYMTLIVALEDALDCLIPGEDVRKLATVGETVDYIMSLKTLQKE